MATERGPYEKRPKHVELPPGLATAAQVAKYLCTTVNTLAQWRYLGNGPTFIKVGHSVRYRWADVLEYLENKTRIPSAPVPNSRPAQMHRPTVNGLDPLDKEFYRFVSTAVTPPETTRCSPMAPLTASGPATARTGTPRQGR
ncbi:MAG: helix-turn-helix transcriptional regulator [Mycobacterium sp.]